MSLFSNFKIILIEESPGVCLRTKSLSPPPPSLSFIVRQWVWQDSGVVPNVTSLGLSDVGEGNKVKGIPPRSGYLVGPIREGLRQGSSIGGGGM